MKKLIVITMIAMLLVAPTSYLAASFFSDTNEHWAEDEIETLHSMGIMLGNDNKSLPDSNVTRAEFAALVVRSFFKTGETEQYFDDVPKNNIFAPYIATAYENGIISGVGGGKFLPDSYITREEITLMISRLNIIISKNTSISFADISKNYKYMAELKKVVGNGIINGFEDGKFYPKKNATRAQAAAMILRTMRCADVAQTLTKTDVQKIIISNFTDIDYVLANSLGSAYDDAMYRRSMQTKDIIVSVTDLKMISHSTEGMLMQSKYSCIAQYTTPNYTRSVSADVVCNFVTRDDKTYLYHINTRLYENSPINLAWDTCAQSPTSLPKGLTHISPSAYIISDENQYGTEVNLASANLKLYNRLSDSYVKTAHGSGVSVWAMYKTDFKAQTANSFLNNNSAMTDAIYYLRNECLRLGIDGLNLDFENMYKSDAASYAEHIKKLTLVMHDIGVIVSADITRYEKTSAQWSMCYDRDRLSECADYIMIMAYDQYYAGSKTPGPVASLQWTEDTIKLTLNEVKSSRLILGIPFYVRYWESINGKVTYTKAVSMQAAQSLALDNNAKISYSESDGLYTATWQKDNTFCQMWLENAQSILQRKNLAKKYSLSGTAAWRLGLETPDVWNN